MSNGTNTASINSVEPLLDDPRRFQGRYSPTRGGWIPFIPPQEASPFYKSQEVDNTQNSEEAVQGVLPAWISKAGKEVLITRKEDDHLWYAPTVVTKTPMTYRQVWNYDEDKNQWIKLWITLDGLWYNEEPVWREEEYHAQQTKLRSALRELLTKTVFATAKTTTIVEAGELRT